MSAPTIRVRETSPFGPKSRFYFPEPRLMTSALNADGEVISEQTLTAKGLSDRRGIQITESEGHAWPRKGHDLQDRGGPFYTRKLYIAEMSHRDVSLSMATKRISRHLTGDYVTPAPIPNFANLRNSVDGSISGFPDMSTSDDDLKVMGTKLIASLSPVSPLVSLPVTIGELIRDGAPTMAGLKLLKGKGKPSAVADEYLNYQFGIKPLLQDLKALGNSIINADRLIAQLKRDSGKVVRRRRDFSTETEVYYEASGERLPNYTWCLSPTSFPPGNKLPLDLDQKVTISKKRSFSGAFTYYLPDSSEHGNISRMAKQAERLAGLTPDAADLWNLLPWSWLGDWFVDVGPIIQNATNAQSFGQVVQYAYMMEHTIVKYEYTMSVPNSLGKGDSITLTIHDEVKKRVPASPYGFGSDWDGFSPYQLSILAALGISRKKPIAR